MRCQYHYLLFTHLISTRILIINLLAAQPSERMKFIMNQVPSTSGRRTSKRKECDVHVENRYLQDGRIYSKDGRINYTYGRICTSILIHTSILRKYKTAKRLHSRTTRRERDTKYSDFVVIYIYLRSRHKKLFARLHYLVCRAFWELCIGHLRNTVECRPGKRSYSEQCTAVWD